MASAIGKRKREGTRTAKPIKKVAIRTTPANEERRAKNIPSSLAKIDDDRIDVQIVTGSYERVLHGVCARIPPSTLDLVSDNDPDQVTFSDTFLFAAHASAIRCLAISPLTDQQSNRRYLATGSSDERINVYSLSTVPPRADATPALPSLNAISTAENPHNRSLGSLNHHDRAVTCLNFPSRTKLVSAAEDATISVSRTRDWTVLSSIKAPIPKPRGRPSGDTAAPGEVPAGVNDFAIHPSQRLMLTVGRGERCLRLWNMMTGKKAGVLNFDRDLLGQVGEGKYGTGEGRRVLWDNSGENYIVGFERGAAVFGIDSKPKAIIKPSPPSKLHQIRLVPHASGSDSDIVATSTEDGRVLFYSIGNTVTSGAIDNLPACICLGQLGGRAAGVSNRIKDFEILQLRSQAASSLLLITGNSDGAVKIWAVPDKQLVQSEMDTSNSKLQPTVSQFGYLIGTLDTGNRITCLGAFLLNGNSSDQASDDVELNVLNNDEPSNEEEDSNDVS